MTRCPRCQSVVSLVFVHGHYQCPMCKSNVDDCCQGEVCQVPETKKSKPKRLRKKCSCCGNDAGVWEQYWNQDKGYGICAKCIEWHKKLGHTKEQIKENFGISNVHYEGEEG